MKENKYDEEGFFQKYSEIILALYIPFPLFLSHVSNLALFGLFDCQFVHSIA